MRLRMLIVTLLASLTPLVLSGPASAAYSPSGSGSGDSLRTWEKLARCESGGRWHIATGNGYYGGLQISRSTWQAYGGRHFATNASRATKGEQITVGKRIRRGQGWRAWPVCSARIGLR